MTRLFARYFRVSTFLLFWAAVFVGLFLVSSRACAQDLAPEMPSPLCEQYSMRHGKIVKELGLCSGFGYLPAITWHSGATGDLMPTVGCLPGRFWDGSKCTDLDGGLTYLSSLIFGDQRILVSNLYKPLDQKTTWTFTIDGKEYSLDGDKLAALVKLFGKGRD